MKAELRSSLLEQRRALTEGDWQKRSLALCAQIIQWPEWGEFDHIGLYRSFRKEADLHSLLDLSPDKSFYFPLIDQTTGAMEFYGYSGEGAFKHNTWGLFQPDGTGKAMPIGANTLIIVPALAFDDHGHRLGYGKGFYDRYLHRHRLSTLGVCFREFVLEKLPSESHDQAVDTVMTEEGLRFRTHFC
ncbi:MAG: 5-formyltetrahydrofolate cyclo-ligase [Chitinophagaceae bacterium]|nr:5-formyltetrahydrofolate cyclo-ligase [Oligoflexus sp.]